MARPSLLSVSHLSFFLRFQSFTTLRRLQSCPGQTCPLLVPQFLPLLSSLTTLFPSMAAQSPIFFPRHLLPLPQPYLSPSSSLSPPQTVQPPSTSPCSPPLSPKNSHSVFTTDGGSDVHRSSHLSPHQTSVHRPIAMILRITHTWPPVRLE